MTPLSVLEMAESTDLERVDKLIAINVWLVREVSTGSGWGYTERLVHAQTALLTALRASIAA